MRGPVGSLVAPETVADHQAFDAGGGVTVYLQDLVLEKAAEGVLAFQFGLLGRCTVVIGPQAAG